MLNTFNYYFWEFWAPFNPTEGNYGAQKCTFDGLNKLIIVNPDVNEIKVKEDVYSAWKEWTSVRDNSKFEDAIRVTGGDPIGVGAYTGDVYFLINGWRLYIDHSCNVDGVIYSDDYPTPFASVPSVSIVTNKVSALVQTVAPVVDNLQVTVDPLAPTVEQIRQEIDSNSTKLQEIVVKQDQLANTQGEALTRTEFIALQ